MTLWFRLLMLICACIALIAFQPSNATQAVSTNNQNNTFTATNTGLTASATSALFTSNNLQPGDSLERCINLKNTGVVSFDSVGISGSSSGVLSDTIDVTIDTGTGITGSSCTGFVQTTADTFVGELSDLPLASDPTVDPTNIAINASVSYRLTLTVPDDISQSTQGQATTFAIRWEART